MESQGQWGSPCPEGDAGALGLVLQGDGGGPGLFERQPVALATEVGWGQFPPKATGRPGGRLPYGITKGEAGLWENQSQVWP
jgi:hypothetical protein